MYTDLYTWHLHAVVWQGTLYRTMENLKGFVQDELPTRRIRSVTSLWSTRFPRLRSRLRSRPRQRPRPWSDPEASGRQLSQHV